MQGQRHFQRRSVLPLDEDAVNVRRQASVAKLRPVDSAEHDLGSRKYLASIEEHEVKRWRHDGDGDINLLVLVFLLEEIAKQRPVRTGSEPGEVHRLAIDL